MRDNRYFSRWFSSLRELPGAGEAMSPGGIRVSKLKYLLAFPLAMIIVNVQDDLIGYLPGFGRLPVTTYAFLAFATGAVLFFSCTKEDNIAAVSGFAALLTAAGLFLWLCLADGLPAASGAVLFMAGIGACSACASFSYVFVLNNTERFFGSVLTLLVIRQLQLFFALAEPETALRKVTAEALAILLVVCMLFCSREDYAGREKEKQAAFDRGIWLALFLLLSYFAIRITGFYAPAFGHPSSPVIWAVMTWVPALLCIVVRVYLRRSAWTLCTLFFLSAVLTYVMWYTGFPELAHVFSELKEIGFILSFYLIGCVTDKFCDFRLHKRLVVISMVVVGLAYGAIDMMHVFFPGESLAVFTASVLFAVFLFLAPAFSRYLFLADWSKELLDAGMLHGDQKKIETDRRVLTLDKTTLSPREKQLTLLLLEGMTLRQAAAELGLSASTTATYSKTIYKKLGINSRAELFLMFVGSQNAEGTDVPQKK